MTAQARFIRGGAISFEPASHEDPRDPGSLKKILCRQADLIEGRVQMVNWSLLPAGKSFRWHYHEDMQELFIIMSGEVLMKVGQQEELMGPQDAVLIPPRASHKMINNSSQAAEYIALGISSGKGGKTVTVE